MRAFFLLPLLLASTLAHAELPETDWLELMPKSDQKALEQMPEIDHNSPEAMGTFTDKGGLKQSKGLPAVMYSTKTVASMNGKAIRLGGYPVPLESDAKGNSMIYPSDEVMGKLYALEAMPAKIDRIRTRIWTSIKAGN